MQPSVPSAPLQKQHPVLERLRGWGDAALGLIYPEWCQVCRNERAGPREGFVCSTCRSRVRWVEAPLCERCGRPFEGAVVQAFDCGNCRELDLAFSYARSAVAAREPVLEVIHCYKYNRALWFEPFLAGLLETRALPDLAKNPWNLIVPVPLYHARQRHREFNQAQRLARHLSEATGIPVASECIRRIRPTQTQTRLSRTERRENVKGAFAAGRTGRLKGARVVLVDDVFTTGATTDACARVLKRSGAAEVCVWTLARGI